MIWRSHQNKYQQYQKEKEVYKKKIEKNIDTALQMEKSIRDEEKATS